MTIKKAVWRKLVRKLRKYAPIQGTISVRRRPLKGYTGYVKDKDRDYLITIASNQSWDGQVDALLHEWAHVIAIELACEHGTQWGVSHAELYRAYENDFSRRGEPDEA